MAVPFLSFRRSLAQYLIRLASGPEGGPWSLVNATEGEAATVLEFENAYALKDWQAPELISRRVRVTLEVLTEV